MRSFGISLLAATALLAGIAVPGYALDAKQAQQSTGKSHIIKYKPDFKMADLAGRRDSDLVEFSNGRRVSVRTMRKLDEAALILSAPRTPKRGVSLAMLKKQPVATARTKDIRGAGDFAAALKGSDGDTVRLPSGRIMSVAQLKFLQPYVEKRLGVPLASSPARPNLSGPAIGISKRTTKEEWNAIGKKPDSTVLESPLGKRITLGEARQFLGTNSFSATNSRPKEAPAAVPEKKPALKPAQQPGGRAE